jgi:hypothetical protein
MTKQEHDRRTACITLTLMCVAVAFNGLAAFYGDSKLGHTIVFSLLSLFFVVQFHFMKKIDLAI